MLSRLVFLMRRRFIFAIVSLAAWAISCHSPTAPESVFDPAAGRRIGIEEFDSYSGDGSVQLHWRTGAFPDDFPPPPRVHEVKVFLSTSGPSHGFRTVIEGRPAGPDSALITGLVNGKFCWFRLAVFDSSGNRIGFSGPLVTSPGARTQGTTSPPLQLAEAPGYSSGLTWSPDGQSLAFTASDEQSPPKLKAWVVGSGAYTTLADFAQEGSRLLDVDWSPDGQRLSYCYSPTRTAGWIDYRIWILDLRTGERRSVTDGRVDFGATWASDSLLVFCRGTYEPPNIPELYRLTLRGAATPITHDQIAYKYDPDVCTATQRIAYSACCSEFRTRSLYALALSGRGAPQRLVPNEFWEDIQPSWSPDGRLVFFASNRCGHYEIWRLEVATGLLAQQTRTGRHRVETLNGRVSPGGDRLACLEVGPAGVEARIRVVTNVLP